MRGWISLHRQLQDHWLWKEKRKFSKAEAWIDLLLTANHKDNDVLMGNKLIKVKRGQLITSEVKLSKRWQWSRDKVRRFLDLLQSEGMLNKQSDRTKTTLTIENYELYQSSDTANETTDKTTDNSSLGSEYNQGDTTNETTESLDNTEVSHGGNTADRQPTRQQADNQQDTNNNVNNDNNVNKRYSRRKYADDSPYMRMTHYLLEKIRAWKPDYVFRGSEQTWADEFRKMYELDKRSKQDIRDVIDWATQDSFWQANILSAKKLREKFDTLQAQMNRKVVPYKRGGNQDATSGNVHGRNQTKGPIDPPGLKGPFTVKRATL